jgi:MoaA/NifB/PqqE/SkfB family radical SAM enzyme
MPNTKPRSFVPHLLRTQLRSAFGRRITPPFVTLYVTTRCDEKCIHCYYWDELNPQPNRDFRREEFERTLGSMDEIYNLFIGGGEPFLRPDLADIFLAAARLNRVTNLYVPTNGQHTERVVETLERTLAGAPRMRFHLNLSVDETDEQPHDFIRGKAKAFDRMLRTADAIQPLRARFPNLVIHTLTTVMRENQGRIFEIYEELIRRFDPDGVSFNYCRGNPLDPGQTAVDPEIYAGLRRRLEDDFANGRFRRLGRGRNHTSNHLLDQRVRFTVDRTVAEQRAQFSCVSGRLACVIYSDGAVTECEINNSPLGNLRDVDYDFRKLWFTSRADEVARHAADGCFCTHECGHYASTIYSIPAVASIAGRSTLVDIKRGLTPPRGEAVAADGAR